MKLTIRNMVCDRCLESVGNIFEGEGIPCDGVVLGSVETVNPLNEQQLQRVAGRLEEKGFALVSDRESELVEQVKVHLLDYIRYLEGGQKPERLSIYLSARLHYNYSHLSKVFSDTKGETIEGYLIKLKIERVKELLEYRDRTLSEIAWMLQYSSVQYLSNQFKRVTGQTVTHYLEQKTGTRKTLDRI